MVETLFYVCGIALVVVALVVSLIGLRARTFPAGPLFAATIAMFVLLVGATTTFAVRFSQEEEEHREAEQVAGADEGGGGAGGEAAGAEQGGGGAAPEGGVQGPGGTLQLAADPVQIAFDKTQLTSKPGEVTIEFTNPALLQHDVAIVRDGEELAKSELIGKGKTSVSAELAPGTYTFLCTVPGHAEAGMEGTLTVK
jgi:plastocyanin